MKIKMTFDDLSLIQDALVFYKRAIDGGNKGFPDDDREVRLNQVLNAIRFIQRDKKDECLIKILPKYLVE